MFRTAYAIASKFTWPVVLSRKAANGKCSCSIGACVVVNDEGWIVTAFHLAKQYTELVQSDQRERDREAQAAAIRADESIGGNQRRARLKGLGMPDPEDTVRGSGWWGRNGTSLTQWYGIEPVDLAIGKLEPFDPSWVSDYPIFKDPEKDFEPGTSLCKLGFPFHGFEPSWSDDKGGFILPEGALPFPRFPIEGILTRIAKVGLRGEPPPPFPLLLVETSTPGLRGQSGGPIFDVNGAVWAVQTQTLHYPLGFDPPVPNSKKGETVHQFLNVGIGAHPTTIFGLMKEQGVDFNITPY